MQGEAQALILLKANKLKLQSARYDAGQPGDVLVRTIASTITPGIDRLLLTNKPVSNRVLAYPVMTGSESIGQVIQVGPGVSDLKEGDFVYAFKGNRWIGIDPYYGCHAEVIPTSRENLLALGRQPIHRDLLTGLVAYVVSALDKLRLEPTMRVLLLGLGSVGLMVSELLHLKGIRHDALEVFPLRGQLSHAENIAMDVADFTHEFNDCYDVVIEATGRILMVEKSIRLLRPQGQVLLMGSYDILGYDYRLIQHKEPVLICSNITSLRHLEAASLMLEQEVIDTEKFFTNVFPVSQYELAYRIALDSKEAIKTVISWI
jgi:bacteriochlorophyllide a dehydrogenase